MALKEAASNTLARLRFRSHAEKTTGNVPDGIIPSPEPAEHTSNDELAHQLLESGRPTLIAGLSLLGDMGYISATVAILQASEFNSEGQADQLKGWNFFSGHPDRKLNKPQYLDLKAGKTTELAIPNTMVYFVAEVDTKLLDKNTDRKQLKKVIDYALTFVHD